MMKKATFQRSIRVPVNQAILWQWHMSKGAFERLAPPWQKVDLLKAPDVMAAGEEVLLCLRVGFLKKLWLAKIEQVEEGERFVDIQEHGPFAYWRHEHIMKREGPGASILTDSIEYALPAAVRWIPWTGTIAELQLKRLFQFRQERMREDLRRYGSDLPGRGQTVLVTGSSGLIGSRLVPFLETLGYEVRGLTRGTPSGRTYKWDPERSWVDSHALEGVHAVIHLAGENIASGRWTRQRKEQILQSRIDGTRTIVEAISKPECGVEVLISASGVNFYGSSPSLKDEAASNGDGFLAEVCRHWEGEALRAEKAGIRTVLLRTGVVLDPAGGALGKMLPAFRMGLGGPVGSGEQGFPWIGIDELLDVYAWVLQKKDMKGPVNAVHPGQISQKVFSNILAGLLRRPSFMPLPAGVVRALFGEMGQETLLADLNIQPAVLLESGFDFRHSMLADCLGHLLGNQSANDKAEA